MAGQAGSPSPFFSGTVAQNIRMSGAPRKAAKSITPFALSACALRSSAVPWNSPLTPM